MIRFPLHFHPAFTAWRLHFEAPVWVADGSGERSAEDVLHVGVWLDDEGKIVQHAFRIEDEQPDGASVSWREDDVFVARRDGYPLLLEPVDIVGES